MDTFINFLKQPTGATLGFIGIAITFWGTVLFDTTKGTGLRTFVKIVYVLTGFLFIFLAIRSQQIGTVKTVDAGLVLAYLGIGVGLIGTGWTATTHKILAWVVFAIGMAFELFALVLMHQAGLI
jgi:cytochrome c oxidase assembly factor CtaG